MSTCDKGKRDKSSGNGLTAVDDANGTHKQFPQSEQRQLVVQEQIRSLRRRLWLAFQRGDADMALRAYNATGKDLRKWIREEVKDAREKEELRIQQEKEKKKSQRPVMLKKLGIGNPNTKDKKERLVDGRNRMSFLRRSDTPDLKNNPSTEELSTFDIIMTKTDNDNVALLRTHMNPSEPFSLGDYQNPAFDIDPITKNPRCIAASQSPLTDSNSNGYSQSLKPFRSKRKSRRESQQPRTPASSFWANIMDRRARGDGNTELEDASEFLDPSEADDNGDTAVLADPKMTTPLHEAARLGHVKLVQLMLEHPFVEPNFKNGCRRTALHMVAGGWTGQEERLWRARQQKLETKYNHKKKQQGSPLANQSKHGNLGISAPLPITVSREEMTSDLDDGRNKAKKAAKAMGKFIHATFHLNKDQRGAAPMEQKAPQTEYFQNYLVWDESLWNRLKTGRINCLLAILSWTHPDDGTNSAGEGASINAVDSQGRTALHYAAELGREDICMSILSSFGAILTVVDDTARTPCELAAEQNHPDLAAELEARALLYTDPYGMDDELLAAVLAEQQVPEDDDMDIGCNEDPEMIEARKRLVAPFAWFRTISMDEVDKERTNRLGDCSGRMMTHVSYLEQERELQSVIYGMEEDEDSFSNLEGKKKSNDSKPRKKEGDTPSRSSASGSSRVSWESDSEDDWLATAGTGWETGRLFSENGLTARPQDNLTGKLKVDSPVHANNSRQMNPLDSQGAAVGEGKEGGDCSLTDDNISSLTSLQNAHVAQFLSHHGWIVEQALESFMKEPIKALQDARIPLKQIHQFRQRLASEDDNRSDESTNGNVCLICFDEFDSSNAAEWTNLVNCKHSFCNDCLGDYLQNCALSRSSGLSVQCPHHECPVSMSPAEVKKLVPKQDVFTMLQETTNNNFIASAKDIRFCPHPGCNGIVKLHISKAMKRWNVDFDILSSAGAVCTAVHGKKEEMKLFQEAKSKGGQLPFTYEGVIDPQVINSRATNRPKRAHRFCFGCGDGGHHFPVMCTQLEEWKVKMDEEIEQLKDDGDIPDRDVKYDEIAQRLWMRANTRPCPKCKAPIEKREGCNHMTCLNPQCKHEFCWICRKDWKLHNTATGGFFRCNRWQEEDTHEYYDKPPSQNDPAPKVTALAVAAQNPGASNEEIMNSPEVMAQTYGTAMHETRIAYKRAKEMKRFLHHYTRWNAHMDSAALERAMSESSCIRLAPVVDAAAEFTCDKDFNFDGKGLSFIHAAFCELLECRSLLQYSYVYSFFSFGYLSSRKYRHSKRLQNEKTAFEQMQSELEIITEQMSDIVARAHLRATQTQITFLTVRAAETRNEFMNLIFTLMNGENKRRRESAEKKKPNKNRAVALPTAAESNVGTGSYFADSIARGLNESEQNDESGRHNGASESVRDALRASLEAFMANSDESPRFVARVDFDDLNDDQNDSDEETFTDWPCLACTYMNSSGRRCAMCGTPRGVQANI